MFTSVAQRYKFARTAGVGHLSPPFKAQLMRARVLPKRKPWRAGLLMPLKSVRAQSAIRPEIKTEGAA
jgi:hypothetical protein